MKTKTIHKTKISGGKLAIVVSLTQTVSDTNDYSYYVIVKETRNSLGRDNRKYEYLFGCNEYSSALEMYISKVEQKASHIAIISL